jgi:DNA invertase Pin-like site-specific DNA recombinase
MKVAIYCRLSEEDKNKQSVNDDSESIQNQKTMLIKYAVDNNWEIFNIYSDDDFRGSDRNRPSFNQLLKDAEDRKFSVILCKSQARFTRELELVEKYIHDLFIIWGIRFIGLADNADTENMGNKKQRQINGLVNEWYLEDLSNNIKSVFRTKQAQGLFLASSAPYGYLKDPNQKGHLIVDKEVSNVVKEIFELFIQGYSKVYICRTLNNRGIPTPTEYKKQKGIIRSSRYKTSSKLWVESTIGGLLINEAYIGSIVQNKQVAISYKTTKKKVLPKNEWIRVPNMHEPIIDIDTWERAQEMIAQRAKQWKDTDKIGLFSGKVKCMHCKSPMRSKVNKGVRYLSCNSKYLMDSKCDGSSIPVKILESYVLEELHEMIEEYDIGDEVERNIVFENRLQENIEQLKKDIFAYRQKYDNATQAVKGLYMDKTKGIITEDEFIEFSREFHQEKENFNLLISDCEKKLKDYDNQSKTVLDKKQLFDEYRNIEKLERIHVDSLIDYIIVAKKTPKKRKRNVIIHWKF